MMPELLITSGIILVLLVLSGFFSGSETALTAASRARMHSLAKQGDRRAAIVLALLGRNERLIGGILLGNNLVNILASALATSMLMGIFGEAGVVYATLGMTFLVLVFAEVLPTYPRDCKASTARCVNCSSASPAFTTTGDSSIKVRSLSRIAAIRSGSVAARLCSSPRSSSTL